MYVISRSQRQGYARNRGVDRHIHQLNPNIVTQNRRIDLIVMKVEAAIFWRQDVGLVWRTFAQRIRMHPFLELFSLPYSTVTSISYLCRSPRASGCQSRRIDFAKTRLPFLAHATLPLLSETHMYAPTS